MIVEQVYETWSVFDIGSVLNFYVSFLLNYWELYKKYEKLRLDISFSVFMNTLFLGMR